MSSVEYAPGLHPVDGAGVLSRQGATILLAATADVAPPVVGALLAAHLDVVARGGDATALADRVADVVAAAGDVGVVVYGPAGASALLAVFGHAWADVTTRNGEQRLALRQSRDGVRSVLPGPVLAVRAGLGEVDPDVPAQFWGRLDQGVVQARGYLLVAPDAVAATAFHDTGAAAQDSVVAPDVIAPDAADDGPVVEPAPSPEPSPEPEPAPAPSPTPTRPTDPVTSAPDDVPNPTSPVPVLTPDAGPTPAPPAANVDRSQPFQGFHRATTPKVLERVEDR